MHKQTVALLICLLVSLTGYAQKGVGMRFATNINHFPRYEESELQPGAFTTGIFGLFYRKYNAYGGAEVGINVNYKNATGKGMPNFPVVMRDYKTQDKVGMTALETILLVGPRFGAFNPKTGYIFGYRFNQLNYSTIKPLPDTMRYNNVYFNLPFGASFDFFTGFGTVGVGAYYQIGLINVMRKPPSWRESMYPGGKWNAVNIEITVTFNSGKQGQYFDPELERARRKNKPQPPAEEEQEE